MVPRSRLDALKKIKSVLPRIESRFPTRLAITVTILTELFRLPFICYVNYIVTVFDLGSQGCAMRIFRDRRHTAVCPGESQETFRGILRLNL
jgi:hypothetical protein